MSFILYVNPSSVLECTQCCSKLNTLNLVGDVQPCIDGCTPVEGAADSSCDANSLDLKTCEVGENLRLYGSSVVNTTDIATCVEGDLSIKKVDDLETSNGFSLAPADCSTCCASGKGFDSNYATYWDENSCTSVCEDPSGFYDCNDQETAQRLGCAHGYDLRLAGGDSVQWSLGTQSVNCVGGQFLLIVADVDEVAGVDQGVFLGIGIGAVALVLIAVVALNAFRSNKPTFGDMPLHRVDENEQPSNMPNQVFIRSSAEQVHRIKIRQQLTFSRKSRRKSMPGTNTSLAEKPDLETMKIIGMGKIPRRIKKAVNLVTAGKGKKKTRIKKPRRPYNVSEAKRNGMMSHYMMSRDTIQDSSYEGGSTFNPMVYSHSVTELKEEEIDERVKNTKSDDIEATL